MGFFNFRRQLTDNGKWDTILVYKKPRGLFKKALKLIKTIMANQLIQFLREAKAELLKVNWPSKKQTINYTLLVIGVSIAVAIFLGSLDYFFNYILKSILLK